MHIIWGVKMVDECLDLTFLKEICVVLFKAAKSDGRRQYTMCQLLGNNNDKTLREVRVMSPGVVSGHKRDKQRDPMSSLVLAHKNGPTFHF